jgi:hypothetical protein
MKPGKASGPSLETRSLMGKRSGGSCELGVVCLGSARATDASHRIAKGSGGTKAPWAHGAANNADACRPCHDFVEADPTAAYANGWKIRHGVALPAEVPFRHWVHGWVLLDDAGGHRPAPVESYSGEVLLPVVAVPLWHLMVQGGVFVEAMRRFGHLQCPGWSAPSEGLFTCGCGSSVFWLDAIA